MSYGQYTALENPGYDSLFKEERLAMNTSGPSVVRAYVSAPTSWPFFYALRHGKGLVDTLNLRAFENVIGRLNLTEPELCKQILTEQIPNVGLKTTLRVAAENNVGLDFEQVYKQLPAWTARLRRMDSGPDPDRSRVLEMERTYGLKVGPSRYVTLMMDFALGANTPVQKAALKSYFVQAPLLPADVLALRLHKSYRPAIEKTWSLSTTGSQETDAPNQLIAMAMKDVLDLEKFEAADMGSLVKCPKLVKLLCFERIDSFDPGECLAWYVHPFVNSNFARRIAFELSLLTHLANLGAEERDQFCSGLAHGLLKFLVKPPGAEEMSPFMQEVMADTWDSDFNIEACRSVVRCIAQSALEGSPAGLNELANAVNTPEDEQTYDRKALMRVLKLGIFNVGETAVEKDLLGAVSPGYFERLQEHGLQQVISDDLNPEGDVRWCCPRLDKSVLPRSLAKPMGDIVCGIICARFRSGNNMTTKVLQEMIDLDVLTPNHILRIASDDLAAKSLLRVTIPRKLLEASESLMARKLETDLSL
ncbi:hypothetical protein DV532_28175 (plasmid) [Pseudomonas sp. Leaf58]|uniref:hypothetical protein n=1 Tax=Pseudomonas sp. Leaf58 TaxID=1736226 RepID=UPI0006FDBF2E|nr:hypothetical protein [Pseudomonas sp. Leaf58]AYG48147.1 hypothetical protein DV532_28175 [Pseudomonas sp. Leaf58]KQN62300.1 hypothetical protein ASF02_09045 [Pseudomonas sp. Leaf58]